MFSDHQPSSDDTVTEHRLERAGRTLAWTQFGNPQGRPVVRFPGTPSCRVHLPLDRPAWHERGLRCITTERPGLGESTRLPGRGFKEHADDVAAILDAAGVDKTYLTGISGGGPHVLAFAAFHPERVKAAAIVSGAATVEAEDETSLIELNARVGKLARAGEVEALKTTYEAMRRSLLADPQGALQALSADAAEDDKVVMKTSAWLEVMTRAVTEALKHGSGGWMDEGVALALPWGFDLADVSARVTWWHSPHDRNAPLSAARRAVGRLPNATLKLLDGGHIALGRDGDILDDLLGEGEAL